MARACDDTLRVWQQAQGPLGRSPTRGRLAAGYARAVTIFRRISRAVARLNRSLGADEGTAAADTAATPALRHIQEAERQEFPGDEFVSDEQTESE